MSDLFLFLVINNNLIIYICNMEQISQNVFLGTELKLNINIEPIDSLTMDDYDFNVAVYCSTSKSINLQKSDLIKIDSNNYIALVDTMVIGHGHCKCKVTAFIPDGDFSDALRTEVVIVDTGIDIVKSL